MPRVSPILRVAPILGLALAASPARAQGQVPGAFGCPRYVDVAPIADVNAPAGWSAAARTTRRWLRSAEMYDGDPSANQRIRPITDRFRRLTEWNIPPGVQVPTLVCQYDQTDVTLSRVVPYGLRRCISAPPPPDPMRRPRPGEDDPSGFSIAITCR
jgi:hypothetical protein